MSYLGRVTNKSSDIRRKEVSSSTSATHTLTWTAPNVESLIVTINGVTQQNNYTVSGTTLTLDTALISTDVMQVVGINDIGTTITPAEGSVNTSQLANDAVTADKLANSINTEITANTAKTGITSGQATAITANTAKVTNATHTGDVTGATALTIATDAVDIAMLSATGTASASTFLRGDNAWAAAGGNNTPAFMATMGAAQSVADDTVTKVEMSVELIDTDGTYDPTTNYRWTPGVVGKYHIGFSVYMEGATLHREWAQIYKNGSDIAPQTFTQAYTGGGYHDSRSTQVNSCLIDVTDVADYFEVYCWIDTDNSSATNVQDAKLTFFWGYKVIT